MTINELLAAAGLTGDDVIPMYDAEAAAGTEPTQKIKASDFVAAMKTLGSLLSQSDVVNNLTSTDPTKVLAAPQGKALNEAITQSKAYVTIVATPSEHYNYVDVDRTVNGITYNKIIAGIMSNANYTVIAYVVSATAFRIICRNAPDGASPASSVSVCYALFV